MSTMSEQLLDLLVITFVGGVLLNIALQILIGVAIQPGIRIQLFIAAITVLVVVMIGALWVFRIEPDRKIQALTTQTPTVALRVTRGPTSTPSPDGRSASVTPSVAVTASATADRALLTSVTGMTPPVIAVTPTPAPAPALTRPAQTSSAPMTAMPTTTPTTTLTATATPSPQPEQPLAAGKAVVVEGFLYGLSREKNWMPVAISPSNPFVKASLFHGGLAYAGTTKGVFVTNDNGRSWMNTSEGLPSGAVNALVTLAAGGSPQVVYAATELGVYRLVGSRWEAAGGMIGDNWIGTLAADATRGKLYASAYDYITGKGRVYAGTPGATFAWTALTDWQDDFLVTAMTLDAPEGSTRLYLGTLSGNLYTLGLSGAASGLEPMAFKPADRPLKITALMAMPSGPLVGTNKGLYNRSGNRISSVPAVEISSLLRVDSQTVYAGTPKGVYTTTDGGINWKLWVVGQG
ncbi:MAG: hypothetical protein NT169_21375 [Chloroflexi bacterium]|nr:hypothetical protein [Chloroflexota bacterium]